MHHRLLFSAAVAATLALAPAALAVPGARKAFDCDQVRGSWNFDAKFGPYTERAVRAYQRAKGLHVDGIVGMETAWSLRITYRQPLRCGMVGPDVLELQRALKREGFWQGQFPEAVAPPQEAPPPHEPPHEPPAPPPPGDMPPVPPEDAPPPVPPLPPMEDLPPDEELPGAVIEEQPPRLELRAGTWLVPVSGTWFLPVVAGAPNWDFSVVRQNYFAEGAVYWHPAWGVGAGIQTFDLAGAVLPLGPFQTPGQLMVDGQLIYRAGGPFRLSAGYRGFTAGGPHFAALGLGLDQRMADWLGVRGRLSGGSDFGAGYFFEGDVAFGLRLGPVGLDVGYRHLGLSNASINGPTLAASFAW